MNAIEVISNELAELYRMREQVKLEQWKNERNIEELELTLTPPEGWEGKNETMRELSKARTLANHEGMIALRAQEAELRRQHATISGNIQAAEVKLDALKWNIRLGLVQALQAKGDTPFDEAGDAAVDDAVFETPF